MQESSTYAVTWTIDVDAFSEREAAEIAHSYQLDPDSTAVVFSVRRDGKTRPTIIDLDVV
jgi:hypothetical protein